MKLSFLRSSLVAAVVSALAAVGLTAVSAASAQAATGCEVDYAVSSQWSGGFGANVSITNLGSPISSWTLGWDFTAGQTVTQLWNGGYTQAGAQVTVTNESYNGAIGTGASTGFGFNGTWSAANPTPAVFTLNGVTCTGAVTGSPSPTPSATATPTPTPSASSTATSPPPSAALPCDVYAAGGTPCEAAHSTVRALYRAYAGNLYQVRRTSDNTTKNIGVLSTGGVANAAAQDSFCANTACVITEVFDQSGHGNNLLYEAAGGAGGKDTPATATSQSLTAGGAKAYALYINPGNAYWANGSSSGIPTGSAPEGEYMVTSGTHVNSGCCFDYGNSETDRKADGAGAMDAIYFGTSCWFGGCSGSGPWVQADLEYGLYSGGSQTWNSKQVAFPDKYVTAMLENNGTSQFSLFGGNAQSGSLTTLWSGALPPGYSPMKKQGAITLGSGGDCCATNTNQSDGTFYEGAIVAGYPSTATENAVQASIIAAGYK